MRQIFIIVVKEILDNIRDRRSFFFAIVYGPILMPMLMFGPMILGFKSAYIDYDKTSDLTVVGAEFAPNLIQYLRNQNLEAKPAPMDFREKLKERELTVVLEISPEYGEKIREGKPAPLTLYVNESSKESKSSAGQVHNLINGYSRQLGYFRMMARGLNPDIQNAVNLIEYDVSSEGVSGIIFGFFVYFILLVSMMTGGFYLAVDVTAGERERNSLEPLLSLPVSRIKIVFAKWLSVLAFVFFSSLLSAIFMYLTLEVLPAGELEDVLQISGSSLFVSFLLMVPCGFFVSSLLVAISAFTRSTKEAQTYISLMYLVPMAPTLLSQFLDLKASPIYTLIPFFGQHELINKVVKNEILQLELVLTSCVGTLAFSAVFLAAAIWLYRQDKILVA